MVTITPELADRIAGVARLLLSDDNAEMPLQQLNAAAYQGCRQMVDNLRIALQSRAVIEQAKGILVANYGYSPDMAFRQLSRLSQNSNRKLREIAADLVEGRMQPGEFEPGQQ